MTNTTSLREKIFGYVITGHKSITTSKSSINYIMNAIEKRIDSIPPATSTQHYKACKDIGQVLAYTAGYTDAVEKIEEMLK